MLFNSFPFFIFLTVVLILYYSLNKVRHQNILLLIASYFFYSYWDWRFSFLLLLSTIVNFFIGLKTNDGESPRKKKLFLALGIFVNLAILGFFKYYNFFLESFITTFGFFGLNMGNSWFLNLALPMGLSFYTFMELTYVIDIYRGHIKPTKNFVDYALFVSFFTNIVCGPIVRAKHFLPQIASKRTNTKENLDEAFWLILWGLFKKVVVADSLSKIVNEVFTPGAQVAGADVLIAVYCFAFEIYCDFSGYTDMARGIAKLFGFEFKLNFNLPYIALNPYDFWKRWHISLSSWFRDYVYTPLSWRVGIGSWRLYLNILITFLLCGLWHGASWLFVLWGAFYGLWLIAHRLVTDKIKFIGTGSFSVIIRWLVTFNMVCFGWLLFRSNDIAQVKSFMYNLIFNFSSDSFTFYYLKGLLAFSLMVIIIETLQVIYKDLKRIHWVARAAIVYSLIISLLVFSDEVRKFIYSQF